MLNSPNMMLSFTGPLPVHCGGGRRPSTLADAPHDCSTSEAFLPTTELTENLCSTNTLRSHANNAICNHIYNNP